MSGISAEDLRDASTRQASRVSYCAWRAVISADNRWNLRQRCNRSGWHSTATPRSWQVCNDLAPGAERSSTGVPTRSASS